MSKYIITGAVLGGTFGLAVGGLYGGAVLGVLGGALACMLALAVTWDVQQAVGPLKHEHVSLGCTAYGDTVEMTVVRDNRTSLLVDVETCSAFHPDQHVRCQKKCLNLLNQQSGAHSAIVDAQTGPSI